uniref:Uncharacterized protein n=1 Tax=Graphocephala atropunctata TaxID=36148 RepID=A0A1B6MAC2_9HEMI
MCEILENGRNVLSSTQFHQQSLSRIWRRMRLRNQLSSAIYKFCSFIVNAVIVILEHVMVTLRGMLGQEVVRTVDQGVQTYMCYQDITELISHHFGSLHEKHSINRIVHKFQWSQLNSEISWVKENLQRQDSRASVLISLKEDMEALKRTVQHLSNKVDGNLKLPTLSHIPPPPPLPPPGFFLPNTSLQVDSLLQREKRIFSENVPLRPFITVECLRQVKLKKTPVCLNQENNNEEKMLKSNKLNPNSFLKKRPNTTDTLKTTQTSGSSMSSPRPVSCNN